MYALVFSGGKENALFDQMFADLKSDERVRYVSDLPRGAKERGFLYRLHHKRGLNRKKPAPFRGIWKEEGFETLVREEAALHPGLCLIFNNFSLPYFEPAWLLRWKREYGVKLVLCFIDRFSSWFAAEARMYMKNLPFDLLYSYYRKDAVNYGLRYFDCYYSKAQIDNEGGEGVYFWGSDTGRREMLEAVWRRLEELGEDCTMGICYAQGESERLPGIVYDRPKEYKEILEDIGKAGILLDIIVGEGGVSLRYHEAVVYGKKLISNNPDIKQMRFYNPEQMLLIRSSEEISEEFLKKPFRAKPCEDAFSPRLWLDEIEKELG